MALTEGQVQVRDLTMGPDTPYTLFRFSPFHRRIRASQSDARAWQHGSWSGVEWMEERVVPLQVVVADDPVTMATWMERDQALAAAFAPVGETTSDVELSFRFGGRSYSLFGRPRMVQPGLDRVGAGWSLTEAAFVATDPRIYSAIEESTGPVGTPRFAGGLTLPATAPVTVSSGSEGGRAELLNEGTTETGLRIRIDGPVQDPRIVLRRSDGLVQTLRWRGLTLDLGQFLDVDTMARVAFLNGLPQASRHPGFVDWPLLPPGTSTLAWRTPTPNDQATVTTTWRHAWW